MRPCSGTGGGEGGGAHSPSGSPTGWPRSLEGGTRPRYGGKRGLVVPSLTKMRARVTAVGLLAALAAACSTPIGIPSTTTTVEAPAGISERPEFVTGVPDAVALNAAAGGDEVAVAWITHDEVGLASVDSASGDLLDKERVNGDLTPIAHPIERPALRVGESGIDVAFTSMADGGGTVYLSSALGPPVPISGPPRPETNLVHMSTVADDMPLLAWLEDSTLSVGMLVDGSVVEDEAVDDLTCDCCNPVPVVAGDSLLVAYRDFDRVEQEIVRNVVAVRSTDAGSTWEDPVAIADEDWFLSGCPFTGPDVAVIDDVVVVVWMDARQSAHPDQSTSTIWVDRSLDEGASFGGDVAVVTGDRHRWPSMAVDDTGVIHLVWETAGPEGGISYAWSGDGGVSFSESRLIVDRAMSGDAAPGSPSAVYHDGKLFVTWSNGRQGYVAGWSVPG